MKTLTSRFEKYIINMNLNFKQERGVEMKRTSKSFWLILVIFSLIGQVAWVMENMYLNVFIYQRFHADQNAISAMVSASSLAATVTTLLIGALSDKLGKRKLFICGGYICWGISIWSFALLKMETVQAMFPMAANAATVGIGLVIIADCIMTFFGSAANDACFNAWLTDSTDETNRGAAEGINAMMPMVAILVVFGGAMLLDDSAHYYWTVFFGVIGTLVLIIGCVGLFLIKEPAIVTRENQYFFKNLAYGFRPKTIAANKNFYLTLLAYAVFGISIQIFMPYLILYYTEALHMDNYVLIFAPAIVLAAVFTFFYGRFYDRKGFRIAVLAPLGLLMGGYILLYLFRSMVPVFIGTLVMLCGYLSGTAIFGAMLRDQTPENKAGMFQGQRIIGQVLIPGIIGPSIGAFVLKNAETIINSDGTQSFLPNANIFLAALLAEIALCFALIPLMKKDK